MKIEVPVIKKMVNKTKLFFLWKKDFLVALLHPIFLNLLLVKKKDFFFQFLQGILVLKWQIVKGRQLGFYIKPVINIF